MRFGQRLPQADAEGYVATGVAAAAVQAGEMTTLRLAGRKIILTRYEDVLYAFSSVCPHGAADLSDGSLARYKICCPDHGYCFDIRSGRILWPDDELYGLRRYEVRVEDEAVFIRLT